MSQSEYGVIVDVTRLRGGWVREDQVVMETKLAESILWKHCFSRLDDGSRQCNECGEINRHCEGCDVAEFEKAVGNTLDFEPFWDDHDGSRREAWIQANCMNCLFGPIDAATGEPKPSVCMMYDLLHRGLRRVGPEIAYCIGVTPEGRLADTCSHFRASKIGGWNND